jgi:cell wall-associated NlpC family hydrolase
MNITTSIPEVNQQLSEQILTEARSWIGTPWHHNQACKGVGVDCARLYQSVLKEVTGIDSKLENYSRRGMGGSLLKQIRQFDCLVELPDPILRDVGDLIVFLVGVEPGHIGICNGHGMIHADQRLDKVCEVIDLGQRWRKRICAVFRVVL